jgi:hypothetical protein
MPRKMANKPNKARFTTQHAVRSRGAVLDSDAFGFQVLVEGLLSQVFAESRLLEAAEGSGHVRLVVGVDEARSRVDSGEFHDHNVRK